MDHDRIERIRRRMIREEWGYKDFTEHSVDKDDIEFLLDMIDELIEEEFEYY